MNTRNFARAQNIADAQHEMVCACGRTDLQPETPEKQTAARLRCNLKSCLLHNVSNFVYYIKKVKEIKKKKICSYTRNEENHVVEK